MEFENKNIERAYNIMKLYLDNYYPRETEEEVLEWLVAEFDNPEKVVAMEMIFYERISPDHAPDERALLMYNKMAERLGFPKEKISLPRESAQLPKEKVKLPQERKKQARWNNWPKWYAAVIAVPVLVALGGIWLWHKGDMNGAGLSRTAEITVTASGGVHKQIVLPDESEVWLRSGSSLSYPKKFNARRDIALSGEAYFTVTPGEVPFRVNSENLSVEVLGTVFYVADHRDESTASVKLYSGSVITQAYDKTVILKPGELLTYSPATSAMSISTDNPSDPSVWISGTLLFEDKTLDEIFRLCERHFGVTVVYDKPPGSTLRHSATFDPGHSIEDVLNVLRILTGEFDYAVENDTIKITTHDAQ